jgi:hypothetical protein
MYIGICWHLEHLSGAALSIIKQLSLRNSSHRGNYRGGYLPPPEQMHRSKCDGGIPVHPK